MNSGSGKLIAIIALAAALPLLLVLGIAVGAAGSDTASGTACSSEAGGENLSADQRHNAQTITEVSVEMTLPSRAAVIAIATAMQESRLINRTDGDRDSAGLFQQRPSQGWGTIRQLTTPTYAARAFYNHLVKIPGWQSLPLTRAAQAVQRSAHPYAYAQWERLATALATGSTSEQAGCLDGIAPTSSQGAAIIAWASKWLGTPYQFGGGSYTGPTVGFNSNGSGKPGWDCSGLTMYAVYHATSGRVKLDHLVASQFRDPHVHLIDYSQLQPGDLVFWAGSQGTRENPAHIGIYLGNDRFINAPQTGAVVRIDSMAPGTSRYRTLIAGGRIIT